LKKTVFVTDASHTIGKNIVEFFVKNGFNVAVGFNGETSVGASNLAKYYLWDIMNNESIQKTVADVINNFGTVDIVINTLDYKLYGPLEHSEYEFIETLWRTNVEAPIVIYKEWINHFKKRAKGCFVSISNDAGVITHPFLACYNGAKWALEGFCESMNFELNPLGIKSRMVVTDFKNSGVNERSTHFSLTQGEKSEYYNDYFKTKERIFGKKVEGEALDEFVRTVYRASTEYSDRIRFVVGEEIKEVMEIKKEKKGEAFLDYMKKGLKLKS